MCNLTCEFQVLEIGLRRFHHELESVESLDDILQLHGNQ